MSTIRGLLPYIPDAGASRVRPVAPAPGSEDRPPRRDPAPRPRPVPVTREAQSRPVAAAGVLVQLAAGPRRRGLKAETAEQARFRRAYARAMEAPAAPPAWEKRA